MRIFRFLFILIIVLTYKSADAQIIKSRLDLAAGFGIRDFFHIGLKYQYSEFTQLGIYVGTDSEVFSNEAITTFCIDNTIHFGALSFYSNRPVWYSRQGYTYSHNLKEDDLISNISFINIGMGREFTFSDRLGVNIDLGLVIRVQETEIRKINDAETINANWIAGPMVRSQLFFSF